MNKGMMTAALVCGLVLAGCSETEADAASDSVAGDSAATVESGAGAEQAAVASANAGDAIDTASDEQAARAFVDRLYSAYTADGAPNYLGEPETAFEPQLAAKIRAEIEEADRNGSMADIGDPFCRCQDWDDVSHEINSLTVDGDRATASVTFTNFGESNTSTVDLVKTPAGWRVYDTGGFRAHVMGL